MNTFIGIDISKDYFDYYIDSQTAIQGKAQMDSSGFDEFLSELKPYSANHVLICMESTGIYHHSLLSFLLNHGYQVAVANSFLIHNFLKSTTLRKTKTDSKDAKAIAHFARVNSSSLHLAKLESLESLKPLIRERENLSTRVSKLKTEIKRLLSQLFPELPKQTNVFTLSILNLLRHAPSAKAISKHKIKSLEQVMLRVKGKRMAISAKEIKALALNSIGFSTKALETVLLAKIEQLLFIQGQRDKIDELVDSEIELFPTLKQDIDTLKTIAGIGKITAKNFMVEIETIKHFKSHKQLTAFIGTDPAIKQSGNSISIQGKSTKRGSTQLRRTIYQMAMGVVRLNSLFRAYFDKKKAEGKKYKQAMICVANKLIRTIFAMLKNKTTFNCELLVLK